MADTSVFDLVKEAKKNKVEGLPSEAELKKIAAEGEAAMVEFKKAIR